jgi:hypothetical protein
MKLIKITKLIVLAIFFSSLYSNAQERVWEESDPFKATEVWGDKVGDNVKVDITCSAPSVNEALLKARKVALYTYIFIGYDSEGTSASGISKLAENSVYEKDIEFFTAYINEEAKGLKYAEGKMNTSKPGGEVKDGKKKLVKVTITVTLKIPQIIKDLEDQGKIKSMENLKDVLGDINVIVKPNDQWLKDLGLLTYSDKNGQQIPKKDFTKLELNSDYNDILNQISQNLGNSFKIVNISTELENLNNLNSTLKPGSNKVQETEEDYLARTLHADLWLSVTFRKESISGGQQTQFVLTLSGIDAYTSEPVINGEQITKVTSGDNFTALLHSTMKAACNDFRGKVLKFLTDRNVKGIKGKIVFNLSNELEGKLNFQSDVTVNGRRAKFSQVIDGCINKLAKSPSVASISSPTERHYPILITPKTKDLFGNEINNNFEEFSLQVKDEISKYLTDIDVDVLPQGVGTVIVTFRPKI